MARRFSSPFIFAFAALLASTIVVLGFGDQALGVASSAPVVLTGLLLLVFGWLRQ